MATEKILLSGKGKYFHLAQPDTKFLPASYKLAFAPDEASKEIIAKSGLRLKYKSDPDIGEYITLRRPVERQFAAELKKFGPPLVYLKGKEEAFTGLLGWGTEVTVQVSVYDTKSYGKGHRLEAVRIDKLVEFTPETQSGEAEAPAKGKMPF